MVIYSEFSHWKWWFSIVMLVYQRVGPILERQILVTCSSQKIPIDIPIMAQFLIHTHIISAHLRSVKTTYRNAIRFSCKASQTSPSIPRNQMKGQSKPKLPIALWLPGKTMVSTCFNCTFSQEIKSNDQWLGGSSVFCILSIKSWGEARRSLQPSSPKWLGTRGKLVMLRDF